MEPRTRLGQLAKRRRLERGLSMASASDLAGVARNTWATMETGERQVAERVHASIERALSWSPGSIAAVLAGGDPAELEIDATPRAPSLDLLTEAERIGALPLPAEDRLDMILILIRAHDRAAKASDSRSGKRPA